MAERKKKARLPGRLRVVQAAPKGGVWIRIPRDLADDLGWGPGTVLEWRRVGRHAELHRKSPATASDRP